jgi:hypothetical protein
MKNSTIQSGHTTAQCHRGSLGQAQHASPVAKPLGRPMPTASSSARTARDGMAWPRPIRPVWWTPCQLNDDEHPAFLEGSKSIFPMSLSSCLSCASFMRPTRIRAGGRQPVPDPTISSDSGSCRVRSPNLSVMNWRDPRDHLEPGRNLVVDWYVIALTKLDLVSPTVGTNCRGLWLDSRVGIVTPQNSKFWNVTKIH